ncbi:GIY-YIG nuclease family protein [Alteromonas macleodii]|jgi:hypothetical protein|uniref:GIY-YIG domain-containing protein n=1 Tax=Alteromonas macleodii TaxID=28108 RepID=A0AB36FKK6_ALTMA|nr:GIY-YIG nuclease family protein [Alteromonas macleodii]OES23896.1 hypothetical protein BFV95_4981 [Alteromonas macleodii]OES24601.1 hypothetical protein BFV94_4752 [Alteromonas macleodii]OES25612.1 hypothetical protein BFV93_4366 [Alteromonas macleodii]OES39020.1 hypothetical protein BFV96_4421 [Alteromonas macleodii]
MDVLKLLELNPVDVKGHLAVWNGIENPLETFFDGRFEQWQQAQTKRNFGRNYIVSLIKLPGVCQWLFVGVYLSKGISSSSSDGKCHYYDTELTNIGESLIGRLVVHFKRTGRNSYPTGETLSGRATIHSILPEPMAFQDFSDFKHVCLSRSELEMLYRHQYPSWKTALSSVSGVYLISDRLTGKQYVGSAYGAGGFWNRWAAYANGHHGGNKLLRLLFNETGEGGFSQFQYSILEVCDIDLSKESVIEIENRWKRKLLSKEFGWNDN